VNWCNNKKKRLANLTKLVVCFFIKLEVLFLDPSNTLWQSRDAKWCYDFINWKGALPHSR